MDLDAKIISKQIRATIFPILKERGFTKLGTVNSFAHPNNNVVHRIHIERFSNYHLQVSSLPRFTISATLYTYYPKEVLQNHSNFERNSLKNFDRFLNKNGQLEVTQNIHMPAFKDSLVRSNTLSGIVPKRENPAPDTYWPMLEQSAEYSKRVIDDIANQATINFDAYHQRLADVEATFESLLSNPDHSPYCGPDYVINVATHNKMVIDEYDKARARFRAIISLAHVFDREDISKEYKERFNLMSKLRHEQKQSAIDWGPFELCDEAASLLTEWDERLK